MNTAAAEPCATGEFTCGDLLLHARFSMAIELLARLIVANPRPVTTAALVEALGHSPRQVRALIGTLQASGLLFPDKECKDAWSCPVTPGTLTLAEIFRSVSALQSAPGVARKKDGQAQDVKTASHIGVDLLVMQATMTINQVVLQHLQSFDLCRLKAVSNSSPFQHLPSRAHAYVADPV